MGGQNIADNYGHIATQLKQIEADKVKMLKGKPPEELQPTPDELSLLQASLLEKEKRLLNRVDGWATAGYTSIDFDPA